MQSIAQATICFIYFFFWLLVSFCVLCNIFTLTAAASSVVVVLGCYCCCYAFILLVYFFFFLFSSSAHVSRCLWTECSWQRQCWNFCVKQISFWTTRFSRCCGCALLLCLPLCVCLCGVLQDCLGFIWRVRAKVCYNGMHKAYALRATALRYATLRQLSMVCQQTAQRCMQQHKETKQMTMKMKREVW